MAQQAQEVIQVQSLVKKFDGFTAVDGISFDVHEGEIFGFLGPNGSGKTTTIRMMLGLLQPTGGSVHVLGLPVKDNPSEIQPRVGYMSQQFSLYNDLTVIQNLHFYGQAYGLDDALLKERIQSAITMADLENHRSATTKDLSGGWRQRLALSAAILHRPEILFLDEPTAGVDPVSRREFWDLLYTFVEQGITVFITTHYMDEAEHCHRLAFLQKGRIIASGSPEAIKHSTMEDDVLEIYPAQVDRAVAILRQATEEEKLNLSDIQLFGATVHVIGPGAGNSKRFIRSLLKKAHVDVHAITQIEPSLEDVFITCMREK